jgi:hypothetical protein
VNDGLRALTDKAANRSQNSLPKIGRSAYRQTLKGSECRTRFRKHDRTESAKCPGVVEANQLLNTNASRILDYLVTKLVDVVPGRPETYSTYKQVHDALFLRLERGTYGKSLDAQGLGSLAEWAKARSLPAVTGLVIDGTSYIPVLGSSIAMIDGVMTLCGGGQRLNGAWASTGRHSLPTSRPRICRITLVHKALRERLRDPVRPRERVQHERIAVLIGRVVEGWAELCAD